MDVIKEIDVKNIKIYYYKRFFIIWYSYNGYCVWYFIFYLYSLLMCDALRDSIPFVQFKKREKHQLKVTLLHGCLWYQIAPPHDIHNAFSTVSSSHACNFIKQETPRRVFSYEDCKIFKNILFIEHLHFYNNFIKKGL